MTDHSLATYDLKTAFGPILNAEPNPLATQQFNGVPTTLGAATFVSAHDVTFVSS